MLTEAELWVFELSVDLAHAYFALPEEHPEEFAEVAAALHAIQNKLMARPVRRWIQVQAGELPG